MDYPISIVLDQTTNDLEKYILKLCAERNISSDLLEMILYKVLSSIQDQKIQLYSKLYIEAANKVDQKEAKEDG